MEKLDKIRASANPLEEARKVLAPICAEKMNNCIKTCDKCSTFSNNKDISYGNTNANILIISDYATDKKEHKEYLQDLLDASDINQNDFYFINAVNCICKRKDKDGLVDRMPSLEELKNCKTYSQYAIDFVKPRAIIVMGAAALNQYTQDNVNLIQNVKLSTYIHGIKSFVTYSVRDIFNFTKLEINDVDDSISQIIETFNKAQEYIDSIRR